MDLLIKIGLGVALAAVLFIVVDIVLDAIRGYREDMENLRAIEARERSGFFMLRHDELDRIALERSRLARHDEEDGEDGPRE